MTHLMFFYQGITNCNDPEDSDYFPLSSLENICKYADGLNNIKLNIVLSAVHFTYEKLYLNDDLMMPGGCYGDETSKLTCEDGWRRTGTCSDDREPCDFICAKERCGKSPCISSPSTVCSPGWTGKSCNKTTLYSTCKKLKKTYNIDFHILIGGAGGDTWTNIHNNYDSFQKQL